MGRSTGTAVAMRTVLAAWAALLGGVSTSAAQETSTEPDTPTLPEVKVQATPLAGNASPDSIFSPGNVTPTPTPPPLITQSTIFGSPPADGYRAPSTTTATIVNVPDLQLPASVSTVTSQLFRDQQILRVEDALRDVAGANKLGDQLRPDSFLLRGFEVRSRDYRKNGLLDPTYTPRDMANVQRIEILKGPSSVLYGATQPSGTVNLITKKPLDDDFVRWTSQFGNFDFERQTVDANGHVGDDDSHVLFRLNAAYESSNTFRDFGYNERNFIAPAVTFVIDEDTAFTWEGEYLQDRRRFDTGIAAIDGRLGGIPINRFLGDPNNDFQLFQDWRQSMFLDHRFNDIWSLRVSSTTMFYYAPSSGTFPISQTAGTTSFDRSRQDIDKFFEQYYGITANLAGEYELGGIEHKTVFGTEQGWFVSNKFRSHSSLPGFPALAIDELNPAYPPLGNILTPAVFDATYRQNRHGFYAQDVAKLNEHWSAMYGLRFDFANVVYNRQLTTFGIPTIPNTTTNQDFTRWTPRAGIVYEPLPDIWSLYGAYSRSFDPPYGGARITPAPLKAELGESWEVGTKLQITERLAGQAAWFWIQKDNITIDKTILTPPFFVTEQAGQQTSQGVELNLIGQLTDRWSTTTNYTMVDAIIRDSADATINDRRPRNVPRHTVNLWTRYNVLQDDVQTLGGGLGMTYMDDRLAAFGGNMRLPDFVRWDAGVFYTRGRIDASLYLQNLFDTRYFASSINDLQVSPGAPFTIRGMLGVSF